MNFCSILLSKLAIKGHDDLFGNIVAYEPIRRLLRLALESESTAHILLLGPPASAKTMFLTSLMHYLNNCYFTDGTNSTKARMIDYLIENKPKYLLIDEIDKMAPKDQGMLLNLMETGILAETKYGKTRSAQMKTSVFTTCNNTKNLSAPLLSRFFVVELEQYTYEHFLEISNELLSCHKIEGEVASVIANAVWNRSQDIRDCIKIGSLAKNTSDVEFIIDNFFGPKNKVRIQSSEHATY